MIGQHLHLKSFQMYPLLLFLSIFEYLSDRHGVQFFLTATDTKRFRYNLFTQY